MLRRFACTKAELSCIIGNLFTELDLSCENCGVDRVAIYGTTYSGNTGTLIITEVGFDFEGCAVDVTAIERIKKGRCINAKAKQGTERAFRIQCNCEGKRPCETQLHHNEQHDEVSEEISFYTGESDTG